MVFTIECEWRYVYFISKIECVSVYLRIYDMHLHNKQRVRVKPPYTSFLGSVNFDDCIPGTYIFAKIFVSLCSNSAQNISA